MMVIIIITIKKFIIMVIMMNEWTAFQFNKLLNGNEQMPDWFTYRRTKDRTKGKVVDNFRAISCLPLMWKLSTGIISEH